MSKTDMGSQAPVTITAKTVITTFYVLVLVWAAITAPGSVVTGLLTAGVFISIFWSMARFHKGPYPVRKS